MHTVIDNDGCKDDLKNEKWNELTLSSNTFYGV